jgi:hypothetical protein
MTAEGAFNYNAKQVAEAEKIMPGITKKLHNLIEFVKILRLKTL